MKDGPHTETGSETAQPANKVVRLPRDWLGPHEELVPFGRRAASPELRSASAEVQQSSPEVPPPSAEDFWGERSAAIHDVVQAPSARPNAVVQTPAAGPAAEPVAGAEVGQPSARSRIGRHRRAVAASAAAAIAVAGAVGLLSDQPAHHSTGGARPNMAAILSDDVSKALTLGPKLLATDRPARHHAAPARPTSRRAPVTKPAAHRTSNSTPSPTRIRSYTARAATAYQPSSSTPTSGTPTAYHPTSTTPTPRADTSPPPVIRSRSSSATVTPTGESGALGPIQSPNG